MAKLTRSNAKAALIEGELELHSTASWISLSVIKHQPDGAEISYRLHLTPDEAKQAKCPRRAAALGGRSGGTVRSNVPPGLELFPLVLSARVAVQ